MKDRLKENLILIIFAILMIVNILTAPIDNTKQIINQLSGINQRLDNLTQGQTYIIDTLSSLNK